MDDVIRRCAVLLAVVVALASCGKVSASDERPVPPAPTLPGGPVVTETTAPSEISTTAVVEVSTTDLPTTTTAAPTTVAPEPVVLRPDGVGALPFGTEAEVMLTYLTARLGTPNVDSGWVAAPSSPFGVCPGSQVRGLRWGPLQVLLGDEGNATRHLFSWVYATALLPANEPVGAAGGLQTPEGIGLGSSIADLFAAFPSLTVSTDVYGPTYSTGGLVGYAGTLSSEDIDGFVTSLVGGRYCGE